MYAAQSLEKTAAQLVQIILQGSLLLFAWTLLTLKSTLLKSHPKADEFYSQPMQLKKGTI